MSTQHRTVVVLPAHFTGVLPAAALPALRAATHVHADRTVSDEVAAELGASRTADVDGPPVREVLFTTDPSRGGERPGDEVIGTPGAALLDAVAVMDRLRSPGGCPWDAEQTHESLLQYLVEECYELYQAIEDGDRAAVREELGDVLLQVLFHARVAAESPGGFDVDAVARELVAKLVGRHPHVFAGTERVVTASDQQVRWEELKRTEKRRDSSVDGVAFGQPAAALAAKLVSRTARAGLPSDLLPGDDGTGGALFALAATAKLAGADPEAALRTAARRFADDVRAAEAGARAAGDDPAALTPEQWRAYWPRLR